MNKVIRFMQSQALSCVPVIMLSLGAGGAAKAEHDNVLYITSSPTNTLEISAEPQSQISLTVSGKHNGGLKQDWPTLPNFASKIAQPGFLAQSGTGNQIDLTVLGDNNLFAVTQNGSDSEATGLVLGTGNLALIQQTGNQNTVMFHQLGTDNSLAISQ